jgi:hypothetical protein
LQGVLGAVFQREGFEKSFWLLCYSLSVFGGPLSRLAEFSEIHSKAMLDLSLELFQISIESCELIEES